MFDQYESYVSNVWIFMWSDQDFLLLKRRMLDHRRMRTARACSSHPCRNEALGGNDPGPSSWHWLGLDMTDMTLLMTVIPPQLQTFLGVLTQRQVSPSGPGKLEDFESDEFSMWVGHPTGSWQVWRFFWGQNTCGGSENVAEVRNESVS